MKFIDVETMEYPLHPGDLEIRYGSQEQWPSNIQELHMEENNNQDPNLIAEYEAPELTGDGWICRIILRPLTNLEIQKRKESEDKMKAILRL